MTASCTILNRKPYLCAYFSLLFVGGQLWKIKNLYIIIQKRTSFRVENYFYHFSSCFIPFNLYIYFRNNYKRILLVEDNDLNAEIAIELLNEGMFIDRVKNGVECIEQIEKQSADYYSLILMNIQMPISDSYYTTQK